MSISYLIMETKTNHIEHDDFPSKEYIENITIWKPKIFSNVRRKTLAIRENQWANKLFKIFIKSNGNVSDDNSLTQNTNGLFWKSKTTSNKKIMKNTLLFIFFDKI
jgi:hypothetical protein